jgi:hypothetical protein
MGIADTIAITKIVIAKNFAMLPSPETVLLLAGSVSASRRPKTAAHESQFHFPLKVKSAFAGAPPETATFAVCVPRVSCQAVTV